MERAPRETAILHPQLAAERFTVDRMPASPKVGRFVDHYWLARWQLPAGLVHRQRVLSHPVVNVSVTGDNARVVGPTTGLIERELTGTGWTFGVVFRPAGFRPLLAKSLASIAGATRDLADVLPAAAADLVAAARLVRDASGELARLDALLASMLPDDRQSSEATTELAELVKADRRIVRVEQLATAADLSVRRLQRSFSDHVGLAPKNVIRRYRLQEVADRALADDIDWAAVAAELGYADQAHLVRDFRAVVGETPARYARAQSKPRAD